MAVQVPENAHIDLFGDGWACNRPYRKQQDGCTPPTIDAASAAHFSRRSE